MPKIGGNAPSQQYHEDYTTGLMAGERLRETNFRESAHVSREVEADADRGPIRELIPDFELRPKNLPEVAARQGYVQRWVRMSPAGSTDARDMMNFDHKMRQGWTPRDPATLPARLRSFIVTKGAGDENRFRSGNMILCEMPQQLADRYEAERMKVQQSQMRLATAAGFNERLRQAVGSVRGADLAKPANEETQMVIERGRGSVPATMAD